MTQIVIQRGALKTLPKHAKRLGAACAIITDKNVAGIARRMVTSLEQAGMQTHLITLPSGEKMKALHVVEKICGTLVRKSLRRDAVIIGIGGGVVDDLAGFVASIYMRGVPYISVPTSVLAMADGSIGGKNGVNLKEGKNLVGTFTQPDVVLMDPEVLKSLPQRVFIEGLAEIVKHAVIADEKLLRLFERDYKKILARDADLVTKILKRSVAIKLSISDEDVRESIATKNDTTSRMFLNYGHSIGHALEKLSNYTMLHGEAVSIGMVEENKIAVERGLLKEEEAERIQAVLKKLKLPTEIPANYKQRDIRRTMMRDKKVVSGKLILALPNGIGQATLETL
ncbi:3-dehydroquinate synthase [Candidatus Peregrinibacteria bacterium CG11_big_fil_rev_8_21_14_0_20_46_8]|nr:MAG: 3-dehydroquinate synthase [Candidatus Peregrinibacteria bacterium CG11_big_fil_rev_8_21_14_0_20_46_8]